MSKFTPGPWAVSGVRYRMNGCEWQNISSYDAKAKRDVNVAVVSIDPRTLEGIADARLIASAPALLEALQELHLKTVVGTDAERHAALNKAWQAIASATGEA